MKEKYGIFDIETYSYPTEEKREAVRVQIRALCEKIAAKGLSMTCNSANLVPLNKDSIKKVKLVYMGYSDEVYENLKYAVDEFKKYGAECTLQNDFTNTDTWLLYD